MTLICKIFGHKYVDRYWANPDYVVKFYGKCIRCGEKKPLDPRLEAFYHEHNHD